MIISIYSHLMLRVCEDDRRVLGVSLAAKLEIESK